MQRKDQEFIDHVNYSRETNNFPFTPFVYLYSQTLLAPDYMRDPNHFIMDLMNFPKAVSASHNNSDNLTTDLHFHNSLFPVVSAEDHQHSNEPSKTPPSSVFLPLNNDFLMPVQKSYNNTVDSAGTVEENGVKVVQQLLLTDNNVSLDVSVFA